MPGLKLSPQLSALTRNYRFVKDTEGMSPASVFRLAGRRETLYLKISDRRYRGTTYDVEREKNIMLWLKGKLPVPDVLFFEQFDGSHFLLMSAADGVPGGEDYATHRDPERMVRLYSEGIRLFQSVSTAGCPFDNNAANRLAELDDLLRRGLADVDPGNWEADTPFTDPEALFTYLKTHQPDEELVFSHGDLCDSNLFVRDDRISGFIDLGRSGKADRWYDIAFCVRSIQTDLGGRKEHLDLFFNLLGLEPDWQKIRYYILLDELF